MKWHMLSGGPELYKRCTFLPFHLQNQMDNSSKEQLHNNIILTLALLLLG